MTRKKDRTTELAAINLAAGISKGFPAERMIGTRNLTVALEALVDAHSVRAVLLDLAFICVEKADHLRSNWQDEVTAKAWDRASKICDKAQLKVEV
jgi:hypothetical protein